MRNITLPPEIFNSMMSGLEYGIAALRDELYNYESVTTGTNYEIQRMMLDEYIQTYDMAIAIREAYQQ